MGSRTSLIAWLCAALLVTASPAPAQGPIVNPSFELEDSLNGWTTYSYTSEPGIPTVGCCGQYPCPFYLLEPPDAPDGSNVCGIQSYHTTGNGGVCQTFTWSGGPAAISADGRVYSADYDGEPTENGCLVHMGLAYNETTDRNAVVEWFDFPWQYDWSTRALLVPGAGTYTLFIEAYQPNADAYMSTLWDHVQFWEQTPIVISSGPSIAPDPASPETSAIVTWTTNVPSTSRVDYGSTAYYGYIASSTDLQTDHSVTITGMTHSKEYHYRVMSTAFAHTDAVSADGIFHTPIWMDNVVVALGPGGETVEMSWNTDIPSTSQVEYWPEASGPHLFTLETSVQTTDHHVSITGLSVGVYYCFRAWSRHTGYTNAASGDPTLVILPPVSSSLQNGGFEDGPDPESHSLYPWVQYTAPAPGFNPIDGLVGPFEQGWYIGIGAYDGAYFLGTAAFEGYKNGGVFQRVSVTPGQYYSLSARYITHRLGGENGQDLVRIGIDPDGGTDPTSTNVRWWSGYSVTNDNQWQLAGLTAIAGSGGVATVFLDFYQRYALWEHVAAIDGVSFMQPHVTSVGALKSASGNLGAILENKIVTYVAPVIYGSDQYIRAYVEEDSRGSGIAVLFPDGSLNCPAVGNRVTVTGALGVYGREAAVVAVAEGWTVDHGTYALPNPFAMQQSSIGTAVLNQPPLLGKIIGLCTVGLRIRLCGTVTSADPEGTPADVIAHIDDGGKILDGSGSAGIRVKLPYKSGTGVWVGDQVTVTGVLSIEFVDPNNWPDPTDYYTYALLCGSPDDWTVVSSSHQSGQSLKLPSRR